MNALLGSLGESELDLLRATEADRMAKLDEDDLLDLHSRIRRARTKYVKLYRRQASSQVAKTGARGKAHPKNRRNAERAEVFEDALARVSKRVDVVARKAAKQLKAERLAAARKEASKPGNSRQPAATKTKSRARTHNKTTGGKKRDASSRAKGARRQAKRDSR